MKSTKRQYEVIVGNVGTIYSGHLGFDAYRLYQKYIGISKAGCDRAGGEDVTLMCDNEIVREYQGTLSRSAMDVDA